MLEKMNKTMEHVWLGIAIASAIWVTVEISMNGWADGKQWLPVPCIAGSMFAFRRFFRKRMESKKQEENNS